MDSVVMDSGNGGCKFNHRCYFVARNMRYGEERGVTGACCII